MSKNHLTHPKKKKNKTMAELSPEERERRRAYNREYNKKPEMREYRRQYDASARGKVRGQKWRASRQGKAYQKAYNQRPATKDAARRKLRALREEALVIYSSKENEPICACCGETNIGFLSIDHVDNNGAIHRRKLNVPTGGAPFFRKLKNAGWPNDPPLQVLCYNCNIGRQNNCGICPHKGLVDASKPKVAKPAGEILTQDHLPLFDKLEIPE